jgi:hypothetical protein
VLVFRGVPQGGEHDLDIRIVLNGRHQPLVVEVAVGDFRIDTDLAGGGERFGDKGGNLCGAQMRVGRLSLQPVVLQQCVQFGCMRLLGADDVRNGRTSPNFVMTAA